MGKLGYSIKDTETYKELLYDYKDLIIKFDFLAEENDKLKNKLNITIEVLEKIAKTLDTIIRVDELKYAADALAVELVYMQSIATQTLTLVKELNEKNN